MYERLIYVSRAQVPVTPQLLYELGRVAHNRNSHFGISGALLMLDGFFIQVLEGEPFRVRERFEVIVHDRRHRMIELRQHVRCQELLFPADWMALRVDADVPAALRERFGYLPGLPSSRFSAERLVEFVLACCNEELQPA